ncbi:MAG: LacI family DNA-binding transcriptional regulator [Fibrella sp.]|nr:LacI family DNA-binding transcriptional regulator [Armatimonadota bacterium]
MNIMITCPHCHQSTSQVRAGLSQGRQRYKCAHCQRRYIESPQTPVYSDALHQRVSALHETGKGIRAIAREVGVNHQTVANWLLKKHATSALTVAPPLTAEEAIPERGWEGTRDTERRRATIRDVALQAGISTATVSNYLNNQGYIRAETAERIRQAIEALHFTPNALVRAIRQRRTHILGVLLFGVTELEKNSISQLVLSGINEAADRAEYNVLLYPGWLYRPHRHPGLAFLDGHIDGLIWVAPGWTEPVLEEVARAGLPVVALLSRHVPETVGYVNADNIRGVSEMVQYLYQRGHRRIGWIGPAHSSNYSDRLDGYRRGLAACELPDDETITYVLKENIWEESLYAAALEDCLSQPLPPTVIVTPDDGLAAILIRLILARGLRIPDDIAVVGVNGIPYYIQGVGDKLTTLRQPFRALGNLAVKNLLQKIAGAPHEECCSTLPMELIPGQTA